MDLYSEFPYDDDSRKQAIWLLANEIDRHRTLGPEAYRPTWLSDCILTALGKKVARRTLAGCVGLAMVALENAGRNPSLRAAATVIDEFANSAGKLDFILFTGSKGWREASKPLTGGVDNIETIFRAYRPSAQICAAQFVCSEYLEPLQPFDAAPEATEHYLVTAIYYQRRLVNLASAENWNLWNIVASQPNSEIAAAPLQPSLERLEQLLGPWLDAETARAERQE
ncbi:MAG: hypothetical protein AAGO57_03815 [Pseudomonadota bacterium]